MGFAPRDTDRDVGLKKHQATEDVEDDVGHAVYRSRFAAPHAQRRELKASVSKAVLRVTLPLHLLPRYRSLSPLAAVRAFTAIAASSAVNSTPHSPMRTARVRASSVFGARSP